jgi:zinc transport system permease protein
MSFEILTYAFMHRALIAGTAIAILCSVMGLFLVLRRYSLFGDALAHSSFGGIALGLFAGIYPLWTAYGVSIISALLITKIKERYNISGDASIAVLLSSGIAVGLVIISFSGGFSLDIFSFLFVILMIILLLYRQILYSTFNERQAKVSGVQVDKINYLIIILAGITVVTAVQLVGVLLISALFVIPNVTAIMYGRGFKQTMFISMTIAVSSVIAGILISYVFDITPAGTIVLFAIGVLAVTMGIKSAGLLSKN